MFPVFLQAVVQNSPLYLLVLQHQHHHIFKETFCYRKTAFASFERFWRSAKVERIYLNDYNTIQELKRDISQYIEFYNYYRFHQTLNYKKPMEVYDKKRYKNRAREKSNLEASSQTLLKVA